jgi:hypothetical protein
MSSIFATPQPATQPTPAPTAAVTFSTDNRFGNLSRYDLVFFMVGGVPFRYTELTPEQQAHANAIYPVTFEARQAVRS